jgi:hypothetical protein
MYRLEAFSAEKRTQLPRLQAPLTGRDQELNKLLGWVDEMISSRHKQIIAVTGEGWSGQVSFGAKLARTARKRFSLSSDWLTGYARSYGQPTYGLILEIVRELIGIVDGDDANGLLAQARPLSGKNLGDEEANLVRPVVAAAGLSGVILGLDLSLRQGAVNGSIS